VLWPSALAAYAGVYRRALGPTPRHEPHHRGAWPRLWRTVAGAAQFWADIRRQTRMAARVGRWRPAIARPEPASCPSRGPAVAHPRYGAGNELWSPSTAGSPAHLRGSPPKNAGECGMAPLWTGLSGGRGAFGSRWWLFQSRPAAASGGQSGESKAWRAWWTICCPGEPHRGPDLQVAVGEAATHCPADTAAQPGPLAVVGGDVAPNAAPACSVSASDDDSLPQVGAELLLSRAQTRRCAEYPARLGSCCPRPDARGRAPMFLGGVILYSNRDQAGADGVPAGNPGAYEL